jgi:methylenetetrahydrofolate dehydrogenase (NADP+)/methenyltetrahydrofolate cyclohydrolase
MKPIVLDGKKLAKEIEEQLKLRVRKLKEKAGFVPNLAIILIGDNPASEIYVKLKISACERIGVSTKLIRLAEDIRTEDVVKIIEDCNKDNGINGILFQHPAPKQINEEKCFRAIFPEKDVDGLNPLSDFKAATPLGIITLLKHYNIKIEGKEAAVIGRSRILGKPMAMMLLDENATVTICHSKTKNLDKTIKRADIFVAAIGKPKFIRAEWIKKGAVIIDAGFNKGGIGDVDLEKAIKKCSAYTPVPGGVGPMTIISLIGQVVEAAEKSIIK